ncbi:MAG: cation:proton antiporter [Pirellulaceae bacterium]
MELLYILLVLLAATRIFGELAVRLGQPALVGELISGILIGVLVHNFPEAFPSLIGLSDNEVFNGVTDLGVFFLMLFAGLEMHPRDLTKGSAVSISVAIGGMVIPLGLGFGLGWVFLPESPYRMAQSMFLGTALAITAVPVAIKILIDLNQLESRVGQTIVSAAIVDDVLSLILLSVLTALIRTGELLSLTALALLIGQIVLFFVLTAAIGVYLLPKLEPLVKRLMGSEMEFSLLILVALAFAVLAELLKMHFIIGAFVAGLFFNVRTLPEDTYEDVKGKVSALTKGLLAPIFFASIGLHLDLGALAVVPVFVCVLVGIAIAGKMIGSSLPALAWRMSPRNSLAVGVAMSARGAVELIIADIALRAGLFSKPEPVPPVVAQMFSAVVIMAIVTTLLTPIGLRLILPRSQTKDADDEPAPA